MTLNQARTTSWIAYTLIPVHQFTKNCQTHRRATCHHLFVLINDDGIQINMVALTAWTDDSYEDKEVAVLNLSSSKRITVFKSELYFAVCQSAKVWHIFILACFLPNLFICSSPWYLVRDLMTYCDRDSLKAGLKTTDTTTTTTYRCYIPDTQQSCVALSLKGW